MAELKEGWEKFGGAKKTEIIKKQLEDINRYETQLEELHHTQKKVVEKLQDWVGEEKKIQHRVDVTRTLVERALEGGDEKDVDKLVSKCVRLTELIYRPLDEYQKSKEQEREALIKELTQEVA